MRSGVFFSRPKRRYSRRVHGLAVDTEPGAVTRAVPGLFRGIEADDTAHVSADRRTLEELSVLIAISGDLPSTVTKDRAFAVLYLIDRRHISARDPVDIRHS